MAWEDYKKTWTVSGTKCGQEVECIGHTIEIAGTEDAVTIICHGNHEHRYEQAAYDGESDIIACERYTISRQEGQEKGIRQIVWLQNSNPTPSWTADDKGNEGEG